MKTTCIVPNRKRRKQPDERITITKYIVMVEYPDNGKHFCYAKVGDQGKKILSTICLP